MSKNNIRSGYMEFGLIETLKVLSKYISETDIIDDCCKFIPIPETGSFKNLENIKKSIGKLEKKRLLFLTPEIALIEEIKDVSFVEDIIVCIPSEMDNETVERIANNIPSGIKTSLIREHEISLLRPFRPDNAAIVVFGFCDGTNALITDYNYRMMEYYDSFCGKKVLVSCGNGVTNQRPSGWIPVKAHDFFSDIV